MAASTRLFRKALEGADQSALRWRPFPARLKERMHGLTADEISGKVQVPSFDGTVRGTIQLISFHDAYHIGQLAYLRRMPGLERLVG